MSRRGVAALALLSCLAAWPAPARSGQGAPGRVVVAPYSGIISPVAAEFMTAAIAYAENAGAAAVVLELDTPGGLDVSMRWIVKAILAAKVPVVVFVHPAGARAASAGVFLVMAAHVAAMAPGTNIGAAHPVMIQTALPQIAKDKEEAPQRRGPLEDKAVNDAAAYLQAIAHERGRNERWALQAVTLSKSLPAQEALRLDVVDLVAASLEELLASLDGRQIHGMSGPLRTAGALVERFEMSRRQRLLAALSDPNVAVFLMSLGAAGLFIELYNPGLILPGIVGAISLLLAFYSFQTLSASYAGMALLLLGLILFLLEVTVTSYGMLALGGAAAGLLGLLMLFQHQSAWGLRVSWDVIVGFLGSMSAVTVFCSVLAFRAHRRRIMTGREGLRGARGEVLSRLAPRGHVFVQGERWLALSLSGAVEAGGEVVVDGIDGLTLLVRREQRSDGP